MSTIEKIAFGTAVVSSVATAVSGLFSGYQTYLFKQSIHLQMASNLQSRQIDSCLSLLRDQRDFLRNAPVTVSDRENVGAHSSLRPKKKSGTVNSHKSLVESTSVDEPEIVGEGRVAVTNDARLEAAKARDKLRETMDSLLYYSSPATVDKIEAVARTLSELDDLDYEVSNLGNQPVPGDRVRLGSVEGAAFRRGELQLSVLSEGCTELMTGSRQGFL